MKIALYGRYRTESSNGIDRTIEGHISEMIRRGYEVTLLSTEVAKKKEAKKLRTLGVNVVNMPSSLIGVFLKCLKLRKEFDFLSLHSVFTPLNWIVSMGLGCPRIVTPNGGYSPAQIRYRSFYRKRIALFLYERRMLEKALFVHVLSRNEVTQLKLVAPKANTVIAPNGFNLKVGLPTEKRQFHDGKVRLLFVGRVALMHKGLDLLVRALSALPEHLDWQLDVIGPDEPGALKTLMSIMGDSGTNKKVHFHGPLYGDDKTDYINSADIFVHTSRYEGMPFAVIEAMAEGLPVLITSGTNMTDLVQRQEAGWIVSDEVTTEELERIISLSPEEILKRGVGARRLIEEDLDWGKISISIFAEIERRLKPENVFLP